MLTLKAIGKKYGNKQVLSNINLSVKEGEFFTLLGPSGCGKTTLLRIIAGFVEPESGQIVFNDKDITAVAAENRNIGMVFQNYALFPFMNVFENVAYGLKIKRENKKYIANKVQKYLDLVNLNGYGQRNVSELSGGEQQRVALARALVMEPQMLLLDEPLSNLDACLRDKMRMELKDIQKKLGITCIFVTHDQKEALTMSNRIAVFNDGRCIQVGTPKEIYLNPVNTFVATFIGETNLYKAKIRNKKAILSSSVLLELSSKEQGTCVSIRPQDISITREVPQDLNTYSGVIKKVIMSGDLEEYTLDINGLECKVIKLHTMLDFEEIVVGDQVFISINPTVIHVLAQ